MLITAIDRAWSVFFMVAMVTFVVSFQVMFCHSAPNEVIQCTFQSVTSSLVAVAAYTSTPGLNVCTSWGKKDRAFVSTHTHTYPQTHTYIERQLYMCE